MMRQQAEHLQDRSYPYIEYAVRAAVQIKRRFKNLKRRLTSLSVSWKLIRRWTVAIASKAASIAASMAAALAPSTATSTNVPRYGRRRRRLSQVASIIGQYPFDTFGHMVRRQGRA